ncbi:MAG: ABC transporter ATP-binding protein [Acidobacteriota bacterium]
MVPNNGCGEHAKPLLAATEVTFAYTASRWILREISLGLGSGTMTAVIGANGSGKSTLLRVLAGLLTPSSGVVCFREDPILSVSRTQLARGLAYVPQTLSVVFPFTALEVVVTGRTPYTSRFHFENPTDRAKAMHALDTVGVAHLAGRRMTQLSGGERQLVSFARALAQEPECVLLDEPSSGLDLKHRAEMIRVLRRQCQRAGMTVLMVTHDLQLLDPAFDRVLALCGGVLEADGPPEEVLKQSVLARVYADDSIRSRKLGQRTLVWSEA